MAAALVVVCASPAWAQTLPIVSPRSGMPPAASALTVRLLAAARPTLAFLDQASRLAERQAGAKRLKLLARRESRTLPTIAARLDASAAPTVVESDPLDAVAVASASVDEVSDTILSALPRLARTPGARAIAADRAITSKGMDDLARLAASSGPAFDRFYVETQRDGLERLVVLFRDYVQNGDDEDLRATTVHALPSLKALVRAIQ